MCTIVTLKNIKKNLTNGTWSQISFIIPSPGLEVRSHKASLAIKAIFDVQSF